MSEKLTARRVGASAPFVWLKHGYKDLYKAAGPGFSYGAVFALIGLGITWLLYLSGEDAWLPVLWGGFLLLAPVLAAGFYVAARTLDAGGVPRFWDMMFPKAASPVQLIILGLVLLGLFWVWGRAADQLAWFIGREAHSGLDVMIAYMTGSQKGASIAIVGILYGGVLAVIAYLLSAVSVPLLIDRKLSVLTAIKLNILALIRNPVAMSVWAILIAVMTVIGLATAFLWFVFAFPWLGFASWRAYRDLIVPIDAAAANPNGLQAV